MAQYITINLKKDVIVMKLSEKSTQADTIKSLKKKLPELKKLYQQEKTPIFVTGRILKNKELKEIQDLIKKSINVEVEFDTPKALGLNEIRRTYNRDAKILIQADESVSLVGFVVFSESFLKSALVVFIFLGLRIEFL